MRFPPPAFVPAMTNFGSLESQAFHGGSRICTHVLSNRDYKGNTPTTTLATVSSLRRTVRNDDRVYVFRGLRSTQGAFVLIAGLPSFSWGGHLRRMYLTSRDKGYDSEEAAGARAKITVGKIVNGKERRRMKRHKASRSRARLFP